MDWTVLWWLLAGLIVVAGLAGTVIPTLPGVPLVFAGLFVVAWIGNFEAISWLTVGVLAMLTIVALTVDFLASALGARYLGASSRAFWGATFGAIVGVFFGLPGIVLGPFIGALLGELSGGSDLLQSGRSGLGAWLGMVVATAANLAIAFLMIGIMIFKLGFARAVGV
ncbi:MAG: DUF456 domain-containing protein [Xanthomonadales bacterium]